MNYFPIFLNLSDRVIIVAGAGQTALCKLRLLLKTSAKIHVYAPNAIEEIRHLHESGALTLTPRLPVPADFAGASLFYAACDEPKTDKALAKMAHEKGVLTNIVDNLSDSDFITPAIVDRAPIVVAIGSEGTAPVLARQIKADIEARLPSVLGKLAHIAQGLRRRAQSLPFGRVRRNFWAEFFGKQGIQAYAKGGASAAQEYLERLLDTYENQPAKVGWVDFVGSGPGDVELLTLKARRALHDADVILYDRLVSSEILELARREAHLINVGKQGFGTAIPQAEINQLITSNAARGLHVVRLKSGDVSIFGRLDEEIDACEEAGIAWNITPGITAASGASAAIGRSLTRRNRNSALQFLTGHDIKGFSEHQWERLTQSGQIAAIYMGKKAARFFQGRMLMHGANPETPVTLLADVSRPTELIYETSLGKLAQDVETLEKGEKTQNSQRGEGIKLTPNSPVILLYGLAPRTRHPKVAAHKDPSFAPVPAPAPAEIVKQSCA